MVEMQGTQAIISDNTRFTTREIENYFGTFTVHFPSYENHVANRSDNDHEESTCQFSTPGLTK